MAQIVTCSCGAKVRLPDTFSGKFFGCPRCKKDIDTVAILEASSNPNAGPLTGNTCPICLSGIRTGEEILACPKCEQVHHQECWREVGGCSTYGCEEGPELQKEDASNGPSRTAWGDKKKCPVCYEKIKSAALRCRYCGTRFPNADPLTAKDLRRHRAKETELASAKTTSIVMFGLSLIGCLAPLVLLLTFIMLFPKRQLLGKGSPPHLALTYATIAISVIYCILGTLILSLSTLED